MRYLSIVFVLLLCAANAFSTAVTGAIRDDQSNEGIPFATVTVLGIGHSVSANEDGGYRLWLAPGEYQLKYSHVAHYSETISLVVEGKEVRKDVSLRPALVEVSGIKVYNRDYDAAQRIIVEAIARKDDILSRMKEYSFDAYTKLVFRDTAKADSAEIIVIAETQLTAHWKYPDKHKEIITSRRQSANLLPQYNLVSVGEILNFNKNRIEFDRYAFVSPIATDALDHYNYYLLDTITVDNRNVFLLEVEPRSRTDALLEGTIRIMDSSYAVVGVDVEPSQGYDHAFLKSPHYRQVYAQTPEGFWLPSLIQFTIDLNIPPFPVYGMDYQASIHSYRFDHDLPKDTFDEYDLEVADEADDVDSAVWSSGQTMPLTDLEEYGYWRIDSIEANPSFLTRAGKLMEYGMNFIVLGAKDFFHFNRVEGFYLGAGRNFERLTDRVDLYARAGYAFDAELWQHKVRLRYLAVPNRKLWLEIEHNDEIRTRPTVFSPPDGDATFMAAINKTDAYDYYLEEGFAARARARLFPKIGLTLAYADHRQTSVSNSTEYSLARETKLHRPNPAIVDGRLRSVQATVGYDSRPLVLERGRDRKFMAFPMTTLEAGVEYASPDLIDNDFHFTRYHASLFRMQRLFGWIVNTVFVYAGASDQSLPPQRYFTVDYVATPMELPLTLRTLGENSFTGSRVLLAYTELDFDRKLFQKSRIPLIEKIPFSLQVYGSAFWTDFKHNPHNPGDELLLAAPDGYSEAGFSLGRVLPLGVGMSFTWQLSAYGTNKFVWGPSMTIQFF